MFETRDIRGIGIVADIDSKWPHGRVQQNAEAYRMIEGSFREIRQLLVNSSHIVEESAAQKAIDGVSDLRIEDRKRFATEWDRTSVNHWITIFVNRIAVLVNQDQFPLFVSQQGAGQVLRNSPQASRPS